MKARLFRTNLFSLLAFLIVSFIVMNVSCRKTETTSHSALTATDESSAQLMRTTNFVFQNESMDDKDFEDANTDSSSCKTVTFDPSKDVYPHTKTVTYNYCTDNCKGEVFNGTKIFYYYINPDSAKPGDLIKEVTYQDFRIDSINTSGDVKFYLVSNDPLTLHIVSQRTFVVPGKDGITETVKGDFTKTQTAGQNTQDRTDDVYSITGTASGHENMHGGTVAKYTTVIDNNDPVIKESSCCWRSSGTETTTITVKYRGSESTLTEVLDYGDGTCDNQATLSINGGQAQTVTLPLRFWPLNP